MIARKRSVGAMATAMVLFGIIASAAAGEKSTAAALSLELNNLSDSETGCLATFMVRNGLEQHLDKVSFEVVLFVGEGLVDRLLVLDFSPLARNKTRVRQFDLAGAKCAEISRILINDAAECQARDIKRSACIEHLETKVRMPVEFGS